ncbi:MAG: hypothetical protein KKD39_06960 [Candidatus Altiarchaeota archaeon]|nr:hypothetical protein [Candidatus Altiarchaeota archaeon]
MPSQFKPTIRERNRYLTFEILCDKAVDRKTLVDAVWSVMLRLYGEVGTSKTSLWVMDWDETAKKGIVKVNRASIDLLRSSLVLLKEIKGGKVAVNVYRVSSTLKKARETMQRS